MGLSWVHPSWGRSPSLREEGPQGSGSAWTPSNPPSSTPVVPVEPRASPATATGMVHPRFPIRTPAQHHLSPWQQTTATSPDPNWWNDECGGSSAHLRSVSGKRHCLCIDVAHALVGSDREHVTSEATDKDRAGPTDRSTAGLQHEPSRNPRHPAPVEEDL